MLYIENILQMESHQPYIGFYARDISTAWDVVCYLIEKDTSIFQINQLRFCRTHPFDIHEKLNKIIPSFNELRRQTQM